MTALGLGQGLSVTLDICLLFLWPMGKFSGLSAQAGLDSGASCVGKACPT